MEKLTHINENGEAIMVDVSGKAVTAREAKAEGTIYVGAEILRLLQDDALPKGDVLAAARIAGIMACKKTSDIIPLCHPLPITKASVDFEVLGDRTSVKAVCAAANFSLAFAWAVCASAKACFAFASLSFRSLVKS